MRHWLPSRLSIQLSLLALLAVIPIWALALYNAEVQSRFEADITRHNALSLARSAALEESQQLAATRRLLAALGRAFWLTGGDADRFAIYLARLARESSVYLELGLADWNGKRLVDLGAPPLGSDLAQQPWFQQAVSSQDFAWGTDRYPATHGRAVAFFARPLPNPQGTAGVIAYAAIDLNEMNTILSRAASDLPPDSRLLQIDGNGAAMVYEPSRRQWQGPLDLGPGLREALQTQPNALVENQTPDGRRELVAFATIPGVFERLHRRVAIAIPYAQAFAQSRRLLRHSLLLLAGGTLLALGMVWLTAEHLVLRRVRAMAAASRRLAAGDLAARIGPQRGKDELAQLAAVFDEMADALARREAADKAAREELNVSREQLRNLAGYLQAVREEERTRIAREIHDDFGQSLTILKMDLAWIAGHLSAEPPAALAQKIANMAGLIDQSLETLHRVSAQLRPVILDDFGLSAAIQWQAEEFQTRTGITCRFKCADALPELSREQSTALFRIFQEILTNIVRHAAANRVGVDLTAAADGIVLTVQDDGRGIEPAQIEDSRSFGLIGMRERLYPWNGQVHFEGWPQQGTRVTVRLPLAKEGGTP